MTEEDQAAEYQTLLAGYLKNQEELAELRKRFKRIGQSFVSLGNSLMMHPTPNALDNPSFLADTVNLWDMLNRFDDLAREQVHTKAQMRNLKRSQATGDRQAVHSSQSTVDSGAPCGAKRESVP